MITGLSDHNLTLFARKLTKIDLGILSTTKTNIFHGKPKAKQDEFDNEIIGLKWDDILSFDDLDYGCNTFTRKSL